MSDKRTPEEKIADQIFHSCVLDQCDGMWFDRIKAGKIIRDQIAALTQRLEQAEARIKEYRDKVEGLEMDKDKYRDKWLNTLERATAAEDREKRLRDAVRKIKANSYLDDNVLNRHSFTTTGCEALREAFALIAQPSDQKEAEGASL